MQRACALFLSVACSALQYSSTLSHKRNDFRQKEVVGHKMSFDFLYNFLLKHFVFEEELSEMCSKTYFGLQAE